MFATFQLFSFSFCDRIDDRLGKIAATHGFRIQDTYAASRDSTNRHFLVPRHTQFTNEKNIQRRVKRLCYLVGDRHATPRQGKHKYVGTIYIIEQLGCELSTRVHAVSKKPFLALLLFKTSGCLAMAANSAPKIGSESHRPLPFILSVTRPGASRFPSSGRPSAAAFGSRRSTR